MFSSCCPHGSRRRCIRRGQPPHPQPYWPETFGRRNSFRVSLLLYKKLCLSHYHSMRNCRSCKFGRCRDCPRNPSKIHNEFRLTACGQRGSRPLGSIAERTVCRTEADDSATGQRGRLDPTFSVQAARRSYRWCSPPTCGMAMIRPASGGCTGRGSGLSFSSAKCVRLRW